MILENPFSDRISNPKKSTKVDFFGKNRPKKSTNFQFTR